MGLNRKLLFILGANIASIWIVIGICSAAWLYRSKNESAHSGRPATLAVAPEAIPQEDAAEPVGASLRAAARVWRESRDPQALRQLLQLTSERLEPGKTPALNTAPMPPVGAQPAFEPSTPARPPVLEEDRSQLTIMISADRPKRSKAPAHERLDRWEDYQARLKTLRLSMQLAGDRDWPMKPWTVAGSVGQLSALSLAE